jgi:Zn-finger nucleic acid-binding protein
MADEEKSRLKDLHYMNCPKCGMNLVTIEYRGIQIDRCTTCDGVWLDHGELEAIAALEHPIKEKLFEKFFKVREWRSWD